ncbi:MAG: EMC3/TMCO1 family protein [archaeon]|nr:EMC3/TMCO1 family protein [archaeon]
MFVNPMIDIALITLGLALISQAIQAKFMDRDGMKRKQEEMKEKQKRMKELMAKGDQKSKNELEALEKEMFESMNQMLKGSSKVMIASLVVFLPAFALLAFLYSDAVIDLPIPLPWFSQGFELFNPATWGIEFLTQSGWFGWYFAAYLGITIAINLIKGAAKKIGVLNG